MNAFMFWIQVGIQVQQLVPISKTTSAHSTVQSGHLPGGSHSVIDLFHVQKAKKHSEEERKEGQLSFVLGTCDNDQF